MLAWCTYSAITSLDEYVEDAEGSFDWGVPDEELFSFINALERPIGTHLYGRRMYETMRAWETIGTGGDEPLVNREFAEIWRAAEKVVYSRTLHAPSSARTRIEREFEPHVLRRLKETSPHDLSIGGAELAGTAIAAGVVDECHLFLCPIVLGGGKRALPEDVRVELALLDEHRFESGVVHLHYALRP
ncbi:MAG TPA: dihydrofolate reductase family protein [Acidimicrobiales bacterium]|nr:dihydrofolate reductase family protein [Acidimicrobiales bacterium]